MSDIRPQEGFQVDFLSSAADIAIGGGAAGAGKTFVLLLEGLRYMEVQGFGGIIFRRTYPQITNEGGLWDSTMQLYPSIGLKPNESNLSWKNEQGNKIKFSHLQHEKNVFDYQGSEIPFIGFDELTHFTEKMFFYLMSRSRSTCGVKPYIRATCNPDADSWVKRLIEWWIDPETGYPIPERCGKLRYFTRDNGTLVWGDSAQEVIDKCPHIFGGDKFKGMDVADLVKSLTFIPGSIYGNKELLKVNPAYLGDLLAQDESTKNQLLEGNWNIKADGLCIYEYSCIADLFTNEYVKTGRKYITVDAARFGSDKAVILVWSGRRVVDIRAYDLSSTTEIAQCVKEFEKKHAVPRSQTVCDADGVGGGVIDQLPGMQSFVNNAAAIPVLNSKGQKEQYDNIKTQCYYRSADQVNDGEIYIEPQVAEYEIGGRAFREYLPQELRAIKRDKESADGKKKLIKKDAMRNILGRSPDCADAFMMREYFELKKTGGAPRATMTTKSR